MSISVTPLTCDDMTPGADAVKMDENEKQSCLKGKGFLVKCLAVLITVLIIVLVALFINLVIRKDDHTCDMEHCIKVSAEMIRYIDQSIDPCDDYHAFICGNYMKSHKENRPMKASEVLNAMVAEPMKYGDPRPLAIVKSFYQSCTNLAAIELEGIETLLELFHKLGDWPALRGASWNGSTYDWVEFMITSRNLGLKFDWFLEFSIHQDANSTRNYLKIDIPGYLKPVGSDEMRHHRKELLTEIAVLMGAPKSIVHYETSKTVDFEDDLGIIAQKHRLDRDRDESPTKLAISELQKKWPSISWLDLINRVTGSRLMGHDLVVFDALDYVANLTHLLHGSPKRIQVDFMMWKLVEDAWHYLPGYVREKFEQYTVEVLRQQPEFNRQKFCLNATKTQFPLLAESAFIRQSVDERKRLIVKELVANIHKQFLRLLETASWMTGEIRRRALEKIRDVTFWIGGPDELFDEQNFAYELGIVGFQFNSVNILTMLRERRASNYSAYYGLLNPGAPKDRMQLYHQAVNLTDFTTINQNTIGNKEKFYGLSVIPAGLLQDAFYNPTLPNYLNYATLGKALAHHLFEHLFRENYTYEWWASENFEEVSKCVMRESSNFPNSEFRKSRKLREVLADFVAVDVAYEAYMDWARAQPPEMMLPGLKYGPNQVFWMQASRFACSKNYERKDMDNSRFKVAGPLRHSRHFAQEYNCPEGSRMNPLRKCRVL